MPDIFWHWALDRVASVAMTPMVVASPGRPVFAGNASARARAASSSAALGRPTWASSSPRPSPTAYGTPVAGSTAEPTALTATSAATVVPDSSTTLAEPIPTLQPPTFAPVPTPTQPCCTAPVDAPAYAALP